MYVRNIIDPERSSSVQVANIIKLLAQNGLYCQSKNDIHTEFSYKEWCIPQKRFVNFLPLQPSPNKHNDLLLKWYMAIVLQQE